MSTSKTWKMLPLWVLWPDAGLFCRSFPGFSKATTQPATIQGMCKQIRKGARVLTIKLEVQDHLGKLTAAAAAQVQQIVLKTALDVEAAAKTAIQTSPATGRVYGKHQASAPGEAPATDTGNLAGSISVVPISPMTAEVQVTAEYAEVLELGGVHVEARPFLAPAVETVRPGFDQAIAQAVK